MAWFPSFLEITLPFSCLMGIGWRKGNRFGAEFEEKKCLRKNERGNELSPDLWCSCAGLPVPAGHRKDLLTHNMLTSTHLQECTHAYLSQTHTLTHKHIYGKSSVWSIPERSEGEADGWPSRFAIWLPIMPAQFASLSCPLRDHCIHWWSRPLSLMDGNRQEVRLV